MFAEFVYRLCFQSLAILVFFFPTHPIVPCEKGRAIANASPFAASTGSRTAHPSSSTWREQCSDEALQMTHPHAPRRNPAQRHPRSPPCLARSRSSVLPPSVC